MKILKFVARPSALCAVLLLVMVVAWALPAITGGSVQAGDLSKFHGVYVGTADVQDLEGGEGEARDMDIVISGYKGTGLRINWVNVSRINGRRDVPGVQRRAQQMLLMPAEDGGFFIEAYANNPFKVRGDMEPIKGDPVRWARIGGDTLHVCSFVILEDGRYELQVYERTLTDAGMDILFERIVDGAVVRRITGHTVRAE